MKFIGTFFLGLLIAFGALITQVFFSVIAELFFRLDINFQYTASDTFAHTLILMLLASLIEEVLRYFALKKRICGYIQNKFKNVLIYGFLFGFGFTVFEIILASLSQLPLQSTTLIMFALVLMTHVFISSFFLLFIKKESKIISELHILIIAIIFHVMVNLILFKIFI